MEYYIGIDLGTSSVKLLLCDDKGMIHKTASREYPLYFPKPGWSEQNPEDWWSAVKEGLNELCENTDKKLIKGLSCGGQMHGLVILDKDDNVIRPAILWNDGRTEKETAFLNEQIGEETLVSETGNIAFAGFTAPKILWVKENEPENFSRIKKVMLPKDYINYRLTKEFTTDTSDAAGTLLFDVKNRRWSEKMTDICGLKEEMLPKAFESYEVIGTVTREAADELSLPEGLLVAAGGADNAAAAVGMGTLSDGKCNISLGTSGTLLVSSESFPDLKNHAIHSFCHSNGKWYAMACMLSAASCNKWFYETILGTTDYKKEQELISKERLGKNDVFFLPYLMGERSPLNDVNARGAFIGMGYDTKRADMDLAVLEGVAFALRDSLEIIRGSGINISVSSVCGGGARLPLWNEILANVLNLTIETQQTEEGPGYGAAILAMAAAKGISDPEKIAGGFVKVTSSITPDPELVKLYDERYEYFRKIYPALKSIEKR